MERKKKIECIRSPTMKQTEKTYIIVPGLWNERVKTNAFVLQLWNKWKKTYVIVPELWNERIKINAFVPQLSMI